MIKHAPILGIDSEFANNWARVLERLGLSNDRLFAELEASWRDLETILDGHLDQVNRLAAEKTSPEELDQFQRARQQLASTLLIEPVRQWDRTRPYKGALRAIETYDRSLDDLINSLPETVETDGIQALELLGGHVEGGVRLRVARFRRKGRALALQSVIADELRRLARLRLDLEAQYFLALAQAIHQLKTPWEMEREILDSSVNGYTLSEQDIEARREAAKTLIQSLKRQTASALAGWRKWQESIIERLATRLLSDVIWSRRRTTPDPARKRAAFVTHRAEQLRAIETELRLEISLERAENQTLEIFRRGLESLSLERSSLLSELDEAITWLRGRIKGNAEEGSPAPRTDVVPLPSRMSDMEARLRKQLEIFHQSYEIPARLTSFPRRRAGMRMLDPKVTFHDAYLRDGQREITNALKKVESEHRRIVEQIERAREVVAFGQEAAGIEEDFDPRVVQESLENALSLLEFETGEMRDWQPVADRRMTRALASVFLENRLVLGRHKLGVFTHLAQQGMGRASVLVSRRARSVLTRLFENLPGAVEKMMLHFLVYIGWRSAPRAGKVEIIIRPFLPQEFSADLASKELPAIYRRLFRFEALEDPRFLIGREQEMDAIAQARSFWEAGRPAGIIIVGERGSGKTSLINCALKRSLEGMEVIRGEFHDRLPGESELRVFLANLMNLDDPARLEGFLSERRRVIILEELERTFLRQVGHYMAIRSLQRLITASCSSTLWVLAVNQVAFRFLNAAVALGGSFSHRINAATVSRDALREAILLRHNLSGLRLHFSSPPEARNLLNRLNGRLRGQADSEAIFFDTLEKESAGVFRTAFNIWLSHIETVEAGVLYMKPLIASDLASVIAALDLSDLFALVAILQHGSLTPEEHATVFQKSVAASRAQIDELLAREIIENDPGRPGFRVRPEAMRVVKEALYRRNLM